VGRVTDVFQAFADSQMNSPFSQGNWESLTSMEQMFVQTQTTSTGGIDGRVLFNQPIASWDVSRITNMRLMFGYDGGRPPADIGAAFNQPLNGWNVSAVQTFEGFMGHLLDSVISPTITHAFNQPLNEWNISAATNLRRMFQMAIWFNQDISAWNTSNVINTSGMFRGFRLGASPTHGFNRSLNAWDVSAVTDMSEMFAECDYDQPLEDWDVSAVTIMQGMFRSGLFNKPIGTWDVSGVTDMAFMFASVVTNVQRCFFDQDIGGWDVSNVITLEAMFAAVGAGNTQRANFNNGGSSSIADWDVSNVTNMSRMFRSGDSSSGNSYHRFNQPIGTWDVSRVETLRDMFRGCRQSFDQDISQWPLRALGVDLTDFMAIDVERAFSEANYSRLLTGWANRVATISGPLNVAALFEGRRFNTTTIQPGSRFTNAVAGRAFLTTARSLSVAGATTSEANGPYPFDAAASVYLNADGWYFLKTGPDWTLYYPDDSAQATGTGADPWSVTSWTGLLSTATLLIAGAAWTLIGDTPA
jgi:hypothetical protein